MFVTMRFTAMAISSLPVSSKAMRSRSPAAAAYADLDKHEPVARLLAGASVTGGVHLGAALGGPDASARDSRGMTAEDIFRWKGLRRNSLPHARVRRLTMDSDFRLCSSEQRFASSLTLAFPEHSTLAYRRAAWSTLACCERGGRMTPTKVLFGQILVVFGIVLLSLSLATQWTAASLGYQAQLGHPWAVFRHTPLYQPWQFFRLVVSSLTPTHRPSFSAAPTSPRPAAFSARLAAMLGIGLARPPSEAGHHLRLGALGDAA